MIDSVAALTQTLHFFFPPLRFGRLGSFSPASTALLSATDSSAGRFFSAAFSAAFSRSLAISSVNFALMSLLSPCGRVRKACLVGQQHSDLQDPT
jgi:hypothetical protein